MLFPSDKYIRFHVRVMNLFARAFGVMAMVVGVAFLISAFTDSHDRGLFAVTGLAVLAIGVAFLFVKPLRPENIYSIMGAFGHRRPPEDQETRDHGA